MSRLRRVGALFVFLLLGTLARFVVPVHAQTPSDDTSLVLQAGNRIGQTFVATNGGLAGLEIFLIPENPGNGQILLHVRPDTEPSPDLATASLPLQAVSAPGFFEFSFPSINDSTRQSYYVLLEIHGEGKVRVGTAPGETYLEGALYKDDSPLDAQMVFRPVYDPIGRLRGWLTQVGSFTPALGIAFFLYILPGLALLTLLPGWNMLSWAEKLGLAAGVSLALYPLLLLWTSLLGLNLGPLYAWMPGLAAVVVLVWRHRMWRPTLAVSAYRHWRELQFWPDCALVVVIGLVFVVRFWVIRSLDVPLWGDSYHHTLIAQLIVDHGGLFNSWEPYADIQTLTYHFGFHSAAAVFHWVSGLEMPQAVLWTGQILNGLAVLALYPLATRVASNRWAGVVAVLVGGLLSPMPMGYVNWGRYTQLAGQVILPAAIWLSWAVLEAKQRDWRTIALAWIALGGLAVTHYRILIFAAFFFVAYFLLNIRRMRVVLARTVALAIGGGLLFLPWFIHTFAGSIISMLTKQLSTPAMATSSWTLEYNAMGDVLLYLPAYVWLLLPLSIGWGLWRRDTGVVIFTTWWLLVLLAANPQWMFLPGVGTLSNFAVFIAAYIPASVLIGSAAGALAKRWHQAGMSMLLIVAVCVIGLWGAQQRLSDLKIAQSALVTEPDQRAASWIQQNTQPEAIFLVNTFFAYGDSWVVGSDGGWWLPVLARRRTSLPPINYGSERGPRPDYVEWVNALPLQIQTKGITHPDVVALLHERGITHVYIGQRQGQVNAPGPAMLQVDRLLASPSFRCIYHQDRVWVFEVLPG
jgi:hypothetical protein